MFMHTSNTVEVQVQQFWGASLAWKRDPKAPPTNVGELFEILHPLQHQQKALALRQQAEDLSAQIVKGRCRRKKLPGKLKVVRLAPKTKISSPSNLSTIAA